MIRSERLRLAVIRVVAAIVGSLIAMATAAARSSDAPGFLAPDHVRSCDISAPVGRA